MKVLNLGNNEKKNAGKEPKKIEIKSWKEVENCWKEEEMNRLKIKC